MAENRTQERPGNGRTRWSGFVGFLKNIWNYVTLDSSVQPVVTFTSGQKGLIPKNLRLTLPEANELVKSLGDRLMAEGKAPVPVKIRIDYTLNDQLDHYKLPLEIGAGGSILDQMNRQLDNRRSSSAELKQLLDRADPTFRAALQKELVPTLESSVQQQYDQVAVFFERHCNIAALEQEMTRYANTLPASARQRFLTFTQATVINLRRKASTEPRREEPASREQSPAQAQTQAAPAQDRPPERRRESVKLRLQQNRESSRQPQRSAKRARLPEPGR